MKKKYLWLLVSALVVLFSACRETKIETNQKALYLNSKYGCISNSWQFLCQGKWYPATVPGNIHDDLLKNGLIPDPFKETYEDSVQWVSDSIWTYRLIFDRDCVERHPDNTCTPANKFHYELVFEGLDTYAEVYLNGRKLKSADGTSRMNNMFRKWTFDVSDLLKESSNELQVKFFPTKPVDSVGASKLPYVLPDTRVFTRKAQYESGWDWGPKLNTCGIWKNVYIQTWKWFKKENVVVRDTKPTLDSNGVWECNVDFDLFTDADRKVVADVYYYGIPDSEDIFSESELQEGSFKQTLHLKKGNNHFSIPIKIKNPKLWWPNGMGHQNRYGVMVKIRYKGKTFLNVSHSADATFGLRTVELKREKDSIGESFGFVVNGKPCFMRGADWIPASSYPGTLAQDGDVYYRLLRDAQKVNMNMIRVWGGGLYEDESFYNWCDQFGLLVWQDFMFACNPYPGDDAFLKNVRQEAIEQVLRLNNYPCIALWCGNNEIHNGFEDWGWQTALGWTEEQNRNLFADFRDLFEKQLPAIVDKYSNHVPYVSTSPTYGWGHPECTTHGCSHYWGVWWGEMPFEVWWEKTGRFMAEYGFQSYPEIDTWRTTVDSLFKAAGGNRNTLALGSANLNNHQKHGRGVEIIRKAMSDDFGYTRIDDLADFAYVSQLVQAYGIEKAIEAHRIQHDKCRGTLYWQLNDCWPVASWSSIDYLGRWKALHYRLRNAYANVALAVHQNPDQSLDFYLVNDSLKDVKGEIRMTFMSVDGKQKRTIKSQTVTVKTNSSRKVAVCRLQDLKGIRPSHAVVMVQFLVDGKEKARKVAYFVKPKDLRLLGGNIHEKRTLCDDYMEITLTSPVLRYGVHLRELDGMEISLSDNYFDLLPNEPKTIRVYYDMALEKQPHLVYESFLYDMEMKGLRITTDKR